MIRIGFAGFVGASALMLAACVVSNFEKTEPRSSPDHDPHAGHVPDDATSDVVTVQPGNTTTGANDLDVKQPPLGTGTEPEVDPKLCLPESSGEAVDPKGGAQPTQRIYMHACPPGTYITGVAAVRNVFLCANWAGSYLPRTSLDGGGNEMIDRCTDESCTTDSSTIHVCPEGYAMTGLHLDFNHYLCGPSMKLTGSAFTVTDNRRCDVLACPRGSVAIGFRYSTGELRCRNVL